MWIQTVKGFAIGNKVEIDVFLKLACFFHDPADVGNLISGSSAFSKIQGKMEVVKQEIARVNVDILGISELKWTGMGEFNSDDMNRES